MQTCDQRCNNRKVLERVNDYPVPLTENADQRPAKLGLLLAMHAWVSFSQNLGYGKVLFLMLQGALGKPVIDRSLSGIKLCATMTLSKRLATKTLGKTNHPTVHPA